MDNALDPMSVRDAAGREFWQFFWCVTLLDALSGAARRAMAAAGQSSPPAMIKSPLLPGNCIGNRAVCEIKAIQYQADRGTFGCSRFPRASSLWKLSWSRFLRPRLR